MGDWFQNLVAPDIAAAEAQAVGGRMLAWLVAEEIVSAETRDCVLGDDAGHPPGLKYAKATGETDPHLLSLWTNGLAAITKRTVFHSGQGGFQLVCSACQSMFEPPDRWGDAVDEWFKQTGRGTLACPVCGVFQSIEQWQHDPPWAFGELGFTFWNWPQITQAFVDAFEKRLGSRIVHVCGKA
jgi:hypothetical protein